MTHARGICPYCRRDVAGGVESTSGDVYLRRHKVRPGGQWCRDGRRVNVTRETV